MKKFFLSALLVLTALTSAMAAGPRVPISLVKVPNRGPVTHPGTPGIPGTTPLSVTEDDEFFALSAEQTDEAILLTATSMSFAMVTIEDEYGQVVYCQQELLDNQPTEISTIGWDGGLYRISIEVADAIYEGEFEL